MKIEHYNISVDESNQNIDGKIVNTFKFLTFRFESRQARILHEKKMIGTFGQSEGNYRRAVYSLIEDILIVRPSQMSI